MRYFIAVIVALLVSCSIPGTMDSQVQMSINFNLGDQPTWGPVGYDYVECYYFPDFEVYYSVPMHRYYYYDGGRWIGVRYLPTRYRKYDLYHSYKVVINEKEPWAYHKVYRTRYRGYRGRHDQEVIRDSRDPKYFVNVNHPEHKRWKEKQDHDNGKHNGRKKR